MPEQVTAAEGEQSVQTATTPGNPDKPQTTTQSEGQSDLRTVSDLLDIPPELRDQLFPSPEGLKVNEPEPEPEPEPEKAEAKVEDKEEEPDEEEEEEQQPAEQQKPDKRQKRINRLTRQKSELEEKLDSASTQINELRGKLERFEKNGQLPVGAVPQVGQWMPDKETADSYNDLTQKKQAAEATLSWCDKYKEGATIMENGQERFVSSDEIADHRRKAEMTLMEVNPEIKVIERESKSAFKKTQSDYNRIADHFWPELNKTDSPEYQEFHSIMNEFPSVAASPAGRYYIGLALEGKRTLEAKIAAAKNGNGNGPPQKRTRDIDSKVFTTPRVPIAPHAPEPPIRESVQSSTKRLVEATNSLMADPDGSAESLAKIFQAREEAAKRPDSRTPVKV